MTYGELLETELEQSPEEAASFLRDIADSLDAGDEVTVETDAGSVTVAGPTDQLDVELELEREPEGEGVDEIELEVELEWEVATGASDEGSEDDTDTIEVS